MKRFVLTLLLPILTVLAVSAQYSLFDFQGAVKIERSGRPIAVEKGMRINGSDIFTIPSDGFVEILNPSNSQLFKSTSAGRFATTRIMIDARQQAVNTSKAINDNIRFSHNGSKGKETVYVEKGMVTRSLGVYDPEARNFQVDPAKLSEQVLGAIRMARYIPVEKFPVKLSHAASDSAGLKFSVENTLDFPVYFNVLKVNGQTGGIEISELGQPSGNNVLRQNQSLSREQFSGLDRNCSQVLIMTHCFFDIDELVENIEKLMSSGTNPVPDADLPVYVHAL